MSKKIVLIGAGSVKFCEGLIIDLIRDGGEYELGLVDIEPSQLDIAFNLAKRMVEGYQAPITVKGSTERGELLPGADAVITTIGVGSRPAWEQDAWISRKFGLYFPVSDTYGPPGISRCLRMIPPMVDIANDVVKMCPGALFINYSNPMSCIIRSIYKATQAKVVGLCIGVYQIHEHLCRILDAKPDEVWSKAIGVNHFTWFTELRYKGRDAWPLLRQKYIEKYGQEKEELCWQLFQAYGAWPAVGDGHVVEFMPGAFHDQGGFFGKTLGIDGGHSFEKDIIERDERVFEQMKDKAYGRVPYSVEDEIGEYSETVAILNSYWKDQPRWISANLPNTGQVGNLPYGAVLEATTLVNGSGFHPFAFGELPPGINAHLLRVIGVEELTVEASLKGSRNLFVQALLADENVHTLPQAEALADALLDAQRQWLPNFFA
jgi:alpha-galactosidase